MPTKETWKWAAIICGIVIILAAFGYNYIPSMVEPSKPTPPDGVPPPPEGVTYDAAAIKFALQNAITDASISGGNEGLDISLVVDGVWDPMTKVETVADWSTATATSALTYNYGDTLVMHVYSDNDEDSGTDCYDQWYYVMLVPNEPVRILTPSVVSPTQTSPTYKYQITGVGTESGYDIQYIAGTTPYWGLGALKVYPRCSAAQLDVFFTYGGTTLAQVTDGSSWDDDAGDVVANATFATTDEDLYLKLIPDSTNVAYGLPMYTISSKGKLETRQAVAIMSTGMTAISVSELAAEGWSVLADTTLTAEKAFYKVVGPYIPTKGNKFSADIQIPVDSSAAAGSTEYLFHLFLIDFQLVENVAVGATSTTVPTAYGMVAAYGIDAMIFARAWTVASSIADNEIMRSYLTTA